MPRIPAIARGPVENCNLPLVVINFALCAQHGSNFVPGRGKSWQHGFGMPAAFQKGGRILDDSLGTCWAKMI